LSTDFKKIFSRDFPLSHFRRRLCAALPT